MSIIVHGGAWAIPDATAETSKLGCEQAARIGHQRLLEGASAVDAVEAAVRELEDNPVFDAGRGSVLNCNGDIEMDAMIMDGKTLDCGAVAGVRSVANPVSLARMVMEQSQHCMMMGSGADDFARKMGVPEVTQESLLTDAAKDEYKVYCDRYASVVGDLFNNASSSHQTTDDTCELQSCLQHSHETVGAVAIDLLGNVAAATSTGGITGKISGRVGDSPLIGIGGYADNEIGAVSCTGHGESIIKVTLARAVLTELAINMQSSSAQHEGGDGNGNGDDDDDGNRGHVQKHAQDKEEKSSGVDQATYSETDINETTIISNSVSLAAARALDMMKRRTSGGSGGVIVANAKTGQLGYAFNTPRMCWAAMNKDKIMKSGINE